MSDATDDPHAWHMDYERDEPSLNLLALWHDTGRICAECSSEFTKANGAPSCCQFCKNNGSDLPLSRHPEKNVEAWKAWARRNRKQNGAKA